MTQKRYTATYITGMKWAKSWKYYKYPFSDNLLSDQNGEFTLYPLDMNIAHSLANELGCPPPLEELPVLFEMTF